MDAVSLISLIVSGAAIVGGATWALCNKLGALEKALAVHVENDTAQFKSLDNRVIKLEGRRKR